MISLFVNENTHRAIYKIHLFISLRAGGAVCAPAIAGVVVGLLRLVSVKVIRKYELT